MTIPIHLRPPELALVRSILAAHVPGYDVRVFGSRLTGKAKPASDLDVCLVDEPRLSEERLRRLQDAFSNSRLPFKVDVACASKVNERFLQLIAASSAPLVDVEAANRINASEALG